MRKTFFAAVAAVSLIFGAFGTLHAQSAKTAVKVANTTRVSSTTSQSWTPILTTKIHTSKQKDLILLVSLECGLLTKTTGKSKGGAVSVNEGQAGVKVRVVVDPGTVNERVAEPDPPGVEEGVNFCKRTQQLTTQLSGTLGTCVDGSDGSVPDGIIQFPQECPLTENQVQLLLDTMVATAFNFVLTNAGTGTHTVQVQARVDTSAATDVIAEGLIGMGTLVVEEVRLVKGDGSEIIEP